MVCDGLKNIKNLVMVCDGLFSRFSIFKSR